MSHGSAASPIRKLGFWLGVGVLVLIQQYPGFWSSETLVLDFLPAPLFYQVIVSLLAVAVWWVGTIVAWPDDPDAVEQEPQAGNEMAPLEDAS